jgi:hypothetical protein
LTWQIPNFHIPQHLSQEKKTTGSRHNQQRILTDKTETRLSCKRSLKQWNRVAKHSIVYRSAKVTLNALAQARESFSQDLVVITPPSITRHSPVTCGYGYADTAVIKRPYDNHAPSIWNYPSWVGQQGCVTMHKHHVARESGLLPLTEVPLVLLKRSWIGNGYQGQTLYIR